MKYIAGDRPPENKIVKENLSNMEIQIDENNNMDSVFAQYFTLHGLPASLPYAWITNIFQLCSQIQILIILFKKTVNHTDGQIQKYHLLGFQERTFYC
ncbi:hypothetical protein [Nitrosopumilus sp.]|uniref:hypothetical protein n=1 Tax=Nitrosopumilus sp. TaxID=2024843 RepID=UPI00293138EF|nr:hypothetical protein [Nitrosopumilus sp.]